MTRQEMVDIQTIYENGVIINQQGLRDLSIYAGEMIDILINKIISYDDNREAKKELDFWKKILLFKTNSFWKDFSGKDSQTKTLGVVESYGWFVTYVYNDDRYRWATISEAAIYIALKVKEGKMKCNEAVEKLSRILQLIASS